MDYRKKDTLILSSPLEDLDSALQHLSGDWLGEFHFWLAKGSKVTSNELGFVFSVGEKSNMEHWLVASRGFKGIEQGNAMGKHESPNEAKGKSGSLETKRKHILSLPFEQRSIFAVI